MALAFDHYVFKLHRQ